MDIDELRPDEPEANESGDAKKDAKPRFEIKKVSTDSYRSNAVIFFIL